MKRLTSSAMLAIFLFVLPMSTRAADVLIPVGKIVGLQLKTDTVTVAAFDDNLGKEAKAAGLRVGDEILEIDGAQVTSAEDIRAALDCCDGDVDVTVRRGSKLSTLHMDTVTDSGKTRLGVYLRQGISGIGTITWYDPSSGQFGTLGHGVNTTKGTPLQMTSGNAYPAEIVSVKKGKSGEPGQLKGSASADLPLGSLSQNTPQGVFGTASRGWKGEPVPVGKWDDISVGPATIRSTVSGANPQEYSVEILKIYPATRTDGRNLLLKVTDPALLETTGGIVQGMSGSPILQNGKLIGAVTHVLVNEPSMGYGIFIQNMLDAAA